MSRASVCALPKLRGMKFRVVILALVISVGISGFSFANSDSIISMHSTGEIVSWIFAQSGSARDIQAAVDLVATVDGAIVRIPEGTFDFVEVGEPWMTVNVPAGVSIFGEPTEKDANGQVIEWKTILVMPFDAPNQATWFRITGNMDPNEPSRFSDISLVGYRDIDPSSTSMHMSLSIQGVIDFRVDHCRFKHTCHGMFIQDSCGVIDHCRFVNDYGIPDPYASRTIGYGLLIHRSWKETRWPSIDDVLGQYLDYTVFIEDCYFTKWRHLVVGNFGAHYVFRHNTVEQGCAFAEVDAHPQWNEPDVPCRAIEVYDNQFLNPTGGWTNYQKVVQFWAGSGCIFNNLAEPGYNVFLRFHGAGWSSAYDPQDVYLWNNTYPSTYVDPGGSVENEDYFLYRKSGYEPYPYPHPLTSQ